MKEITVQLVDKIANALAKELAEHRIHKEQYESVLMMLLCNTLFERAVSTNDQGFYNRRLKEIINFMENFPNLIDNASKNPELHNLPE